MGLKAYQCSSLMIYLCLTTSFIFLYAKGETYIVGDSNGWHDVFDFSNWHDGKEFHVGDVLGWEHLSQKVLSYENSLHNVLQVDSMAYENCTKDSYTQMFTSGNDSVVLKEGRAWFICGVDDHCQNGQKLHITVTP